MPANSRWDLIRRLRVNHPANPVTFVANKCHCSSPCIYTYCNTSLDHILSPEKFSPNIYIITALTRSLIQQALNVKLNNPLYFSLFRGTNVYGNREVMKGIACWMPHWKLAIQISSLLFQLMHFTTL